MRTWRINWIVVVAIIVHGSWGLMLLFSDHPLSTTPMANAPWRNNRLLGAIIYLTAASVASFPMLVKDLDDDWRGLVCCIPQQFLMMLSASTAIQCVVDGHYADGELRPWQFILADQLWVIVGMTCHTASLFDWYYFSNPRRRS